MAAYTILGFQGEAGPQNIGLEVPGTCLVCQRCRQHQVQNWQGGTESSEAKCSAMCPVLPRIQWTAKCEHTGAVPFIRTEFLFSCIASLFYWYYLIQSVNKHY